MERINQELFYLSQQKVPFFQSVLLRRTVMNESHCSAQPSVQLSPCASPCKDAWHTGRGRKGTGDPGCPRDTQSHPSKASKRAGVSCLLGTALCTHHPSPASLSLTPEASALLEQILPAGQLPHQFNHYLIFKAFFPDFSSPQFPCTAESKHRLCLSACFKQAGERKSRKQ